MKKSVIISIIIILLIAGGLYYKRNAIKAWFSGQQNEPVPEATNFDNLDNGNQNKTPTDPNQNNLPKNNNSTAPTPAPVTPPTNNNALPEAFNLNIAFVTQAPLGNWEMPYQEACEEAAFLNVHYYWQKKTFTPETLNTDLLSMLDWETQNNWPIDLTAAQLGQVAKDYAGYKNVEVISNPTVEMIKQKVHLGQPVILPMAGRMLGNPYFTPPGPLYHMIVIKGWTKNNFITNDPGLYHKGKDYQYAYQTIMDAIHDWNNGDVVNGQKIMLVVK